MVSNEHIFELFIILELIIGFFYHFSVNCKKFLYSYYLRITNGFISEVNLCYSLDVVLVLLVLCASTLAEDGALPTFVDRQMDKGIVLIKEQDMLLTGDSWILVTDIGLANFKTTLDTYGTDIESIAKSELQLAEGMMPNIQRQLYDLVGGDAQILTHDVNKTRVRLQNLFKTMAPGYQTILSAACLMVR